MLSMRDTDGRAIFWSQSQLSMYPHLHVSYFLFPHLLPLAIGNLEALSHAFDEGHWWESYFLITIVYVWLWSERTEYDEREKLTEFISEWNVWSNSCRIDRIISILWTLWTQTRNSLGNSLQNSPPASAYSVFAAWTSRPCYVSVRQPHCSSPSGYLRVRWRLLFLFWFRLCFSLTSFDCWSLFALLLRTSSPRRHCWLYLAVWLCIHWLQSIDAYAPFSLSALYDEVLTLFL